jgi:hypothetical protein
MRSLHFSLTLLADAVVSADSATAGGHRGLGFIPGSVFLGIAAGALYRPGEAQTSDIFHSGRVRFGDALPGDPAAGIVPAPRSLARQKDADASSPLRNAAHPRSAIEPGWKPLRDGHIDANGASGASVEASRRTVMKTAVDETTGTARSGHLFTYDVIEAGARFFFRVDIDDDVDDGADSAIKKAFCAAPVWVGRSRSAEFGRTRIEQSEAPSTVAPSPVEGGQVTVLLLSDTALRHPETGAPTLTPCPEHFGLDGSAAFDGERSALSARRWSPFHGYRQRPDLERQVIERGSVVVFSGCDGIDAASLAGKLAGGVGDFRESGLGQVSVQPALLSAAEVTVAGSAAAPTAEAPPRPSGEVFARIEERYRRRQAEIDAVELCRKWESALIGKFKGRLPKASQWGLLREEAAQAASGKEAAVTLFGPDGKLSRGVRQKAWFGVRVAKISVADELASQVEKALADCPDGRVRHALRLLGARMPKRIRIEKTRSSSRKGARR